MEVVKADKEEEEKQEEEDKREEDLKLTGAVQTTGRE